MSRKRYVGVRYPTGSVLLPHRVVTVTTAEGFEYELTKFEKEKVKVKKVKGKKKKSVSFDWGRFADEKDVRLLAISLLVDIMGTKKIGRKLLHNFECLIVRTLPEREWFFDGDAILEIMDSYRILSAVSKIGEKR